MLVRVADILLENGDVWQRKHQVDSTRIIEMCMVPSRVCVSAAMCMCTHLKMSLGIASLATTSIFHSIFVVLAF